MEYAEIFANGLTTEVFVWGTASFLAAHAIAVLAILFRPRQRAAKVAYGPAS